MNDELFDEPRKCSTCKVVTYCDNCPVCGRTLPRSSRAVWKMTHKNDVAGEEANSERGMRHERIEERLLETMNFGNKDTSNTMNNAKHTEPSLSFNQKKTSQNKESNYDPMNKQSMGSVVAKIVAVIIIVLIFLGLIGFVVGSKLSDAIVITSDITGNSTQIIVQDFSYDKTGNESVISLENTSNKVYYGSIALYDEDDIIVGESEDLAIFPYEVFDLEINTDAKATYFEINEENLFTLDTQAPAIPYSTFNDYGFLSVHLQGDLSGSDLEILVKHMHEASLFGEHEPLFSVEVFVKDMLYYECYIDDETGMVAVFPSDDAVFIQNYYEFSLLGNVINKGVSKDIDL